MQAQTLFCLFFRAEAIKTDGITRPTYYVGLVVSVRFGSFLPVYAVDRADTGFYFGWGSQFLAPPLVSWEEVSWENGPNIN